MSLPFLCLGIAVNRFSANTSLPLTSNHDRGISLRFAQCAHIIAGGVRERSGLVQKTIMWVFLRWRSYLRVW
jgi:hypothetical protein